jgi:hypothetical protein
MKRLFAFALLISLPLGATAGSPDSELMALPVGDWLSYEVPLQPGLRAPCCFTWKRKQVNDAACRLDSEDWNFGHLSNDAPPPPGAALRVLVRRGGTDFDRVRAIGSHCAVDTGSEAVREIDAVSAEASVALLEAGLDGRDGGRREPVLPAIAYHATAAADVVIERAAAAGNDDDLRRDAVFWLAQARGARGFRHVRSLLETVDDDDLRRHAVFALSIAEEPHASDELRALVRHPRPEIRGEAIFWLAQDEDPATERLAREMLARETASELIDKVVFSLSQLPARRAIAALRELLESDGPPQVRKQAMFWLAQIDDEAVLPVFDELLGKAR